MPPTILGLDIGGANLKAATADKRAVSVPFPLWKNKDALPAALAELAAKFPDVDQFAVTMTGELCDCYQTKREGVAHILRSVRAAAHCHPVRVWGTDSRFHTVDEAVANHLTVAAANWHALATFAGGYVPGGPALLIDIGSTTSDIIPLVDGVPEPRGTTDPTRLESGELVYTGTRRTPLYALVGENERRRLAPELFATSLDVYLLLGLVADNPADGDTADGRPATRDCAHARLSRMFCGDPESVPRAQTERLAAQCLETQLESLDWAVRQVLTRLRAAASWDGGPRLPVSYLVSGSGEFLARRLVDRLPHSPDHVLSLGDRLGPELSACAPAYAVAVLASERSDPRA
ncbi:MAG: hydantoinase/oxoprolinase family protein [Gemmataceae bacterium]